MQCSTKNLRGLRQRPPVDVLVPNGHKYPLKGFTSLSTTLTVASFDFEPPFRRYLPPAAEAP